MDPESLDALGSAVGRQVLIRRSAKRLALYTVVERISVQIRAAQVGTEGLARLGGAGGGSLAQEFNATIEADFVDGDAQAPARLTEEHSFPRLRLLFDDTGSRGSFAHAVAFHGQSDSEAIVVGGGLPRSKPHTLLKTRLASRIHGALAAVMEQPPAVEVRRSGLLAGAERRNIVNRVTAGGNGVQIEQPLGVRDDEEQREAIARAVADFYADLV